MTCAWPRAAPNLVSAHAPRCRRSPRRPAGPMPATLVRSGSLRQARFGANTTEPPASSTKPAAPIPTALARDGQQFLDRVGDRRSGPLRVGGRRRPPDLLDDPAALVHDPGSDLGAPDVNPDRQAHAGILPDAPAPPARPVPGAAGPPGLAGSAGPAGPAGAGRPPRPGLAVGQPAGRQVRRPPRRGRCRRAGRARRAGAGRGCPPLPSGPIAPGPLPAGRRAHGYPRRFVPGLVGVPRRPAAASAASGPTPHPGPRW